MMDRLGGIGMVALLFVVGCVVAAWYKNSLIPAVIAVPGLIFVLVRLFRPGDA